MHTTEFYLHGKPYTHIWHKINISKVHFFCSNSITKTRFPSQTLSFKIMRRYLSEFSLTMVWMDFFHNMKCRRFLGKLLFICARGFVMSLMCRPIILLLGLPESLWQTPRVPDSTPRDSVGLGRSQEFAFLTSSQGNTDVVDPRSMLEESME